MRKKGQTPSDIKRFDKGNPNHNEKNHVHFKKSKSALYEDGTWKHGFKVLSQDEKLFLEKNRMDIT